MMSPDPPPVFVIPGMLVGCLPYMAILASTFECLYDSSCVNTTAKWISNLPPESWPKPLDSSLPSQFFRTSILNDIYSKQMVETWLSVTNYSTYYAACSPIECTYTLNTHNSIIYVLITLLGSYGGLMVALRIVAPILIQLRDRMKNYRLNRNQPRNDQIQTNLGIESKYYFE